MKPIGMSQEVTDQVLADHPCDSKVPAETYRCPHGAVCICCGVCGDALVLVVAPETEEVCECVRQMQAPKESQDGT